MVEFRDVMVSVLLVGLFIIAITSGANQLANDNSANNSLNNNTAYNSMRVEIESNLNDSEEKAKEFKEDFSDEDTGILKQSFLFLSSIYNGVKTSITLFINVLTAPIQLFRDSSIGVSPLVLTVFSAMIILTLLFMGWRLIKQGQ